MFIFLLNTMEDIINNLDYNGLSSMWTATFPDWAIEGYIDELAYDNEDDILDDIRGVLIDEIRRRDSQNQHIIAELSNLDEEGLYQMCKALFPNSSLPDFIITLPNDDIRDVLIDEIRKRESEHQPRHTFAELSKANSFVLM